MINELNQNLNLICWADVRILKFFKIGLENGVISKMWMIGLFKKNEHNCIQ